MAEVPLQGNTIAVAAADASSALSTAIVKQFKDQFFRVVTETEEVGLMSRALDSDTALIVFTPGFPGTSDIIARIKLRPRAAKTPLLRILSAAEVRQSTGVFRQPADAELREPVELSAIAAAARELLVEGQAWLENGTSSTRFVFPNETRWMDEAFEATSLLFASSGLDDSAQIRLCAALREAVGATLRLSRRPEPGAEIGLRCISGPRLVEVTVAAPPDTSPWKGGKDDPWVASRSYSLSLMRQCTDEVTTDPAGGWVKLVKRAEGLS